MSDEDQNPHQSLLATAAPDIRDRRLARTAIIASAMCLALMTPFARTPLLHSPAFIPAYESALGINDLITAVLLFGQFARLRRLSLLAVASGYFCSACLIVVHALSFPDVFSSTGLLGAGPQTTAWLYVFWHGGFPTFVLAYAVLAGHRRDALPRGMHAGVVALSSIAIVIALVIGLTLLSTVGGALLPAVMQGGDYSRLVSLGVSPAILLLTTVVILTLWRRRNATVLDTWLFAVLWVWLCDVSLSAVVGSSRFDLGWYGGRLFGLFAASFVLGSLLVESNKLYGKLATALVAAEAQNLELIRSRSELARVQRLDAVGQLTGGIAHDFNNLLTAIIGSLDMISRRPEAHDRVVRLADNALQAAARGARLVRQMLTFARKQNLRPEVLNPNAVMLEFESFASRAAGETVTLKMALDHAAHPVQVDITEFQAAILNLISNARDAMPSGGTLTIESRNVELDQAYAREYPEVRPGSYVLLAVSDTGEGMTAATRAKAFEPFFTTKAVGAGTGLGLSQVYGFVRSANGHVAIYSEPGMGTTVRLYLPHYQHQSAASALAAEIVPLRPAQDGETVLVVEDDEHVTSMTEESLRELGYGVLRSSTAQEALALLNDDRRIDILFSDVVMPGGMNGVQLAITARRLRPKLRVLLTSGYTGAALQEHGVPADLPLLSKPYRREELAEKLRLVLNSG